MSHENLHVRIDVTPDPGFDALGGAITPPTQQLVVAGHPSVIVHLHEGHVDLVYPDGETMPVRLTDSVVRLIVATILATDPT